MEESTKSLLKIRKERLFPFFFFNNKNILILN